MFFSPPYATEPCGMFTLGHLTLFLCTVALIVLGLYLMRRFDAAQVRLVIRIVTVLLWVLEIAKIIFVLSIARQQGNAPNPNDFIPLYYCSLILYAGILSSLGKGRWQKLGDVFIATGGLAGGLVFLVSPNTSLPRYPLFHFISFHSFILHGLMVFLGLLLLFRGVYRITLADIKYCAALVSVMCVLASVFNAVWTVTHPEMMPAANLMFMSQDFPGTPISWLYQSTGVFFPLFMWLIQAFIPFLCFVGIQKLIDRLRSSKQTKSA